MLVGKAAAGKTRTIMKAREFLANVKDLHLAPTSMTAASLVDALFKAKRFMAMHGGEPLDYNSMVMFNDDWQALMQVYEKDIVAALTIFYDCWPYRRTRTTKDIDLVIQKPQLNLLAGTTPSALFEFMPVGAWGQGFTSRVVLVYSNEKHFVSDFTFANRPLPPAMVNDLEIIWKNTVGQFRVSADFAKAADLWVQSGEPTQPTHPKLQSYLGRRKVTLYKLAMIHSIDRGDSLELTYKDFETALQWLLEVEVNMQDIFDEGSQSVDDQAMDEIVEFVRRTNGTGMTKATLLRKAARTVPIYKVREVVDLLILAGRLEFKNDKFWAKN